MRLPALALAVTVALTLSRFLPLVCFAQQPGPATLEGMLNSEEPHKPDPTGDADVTGAAPKRPQGTVARPKDGVQHPDLGKAWADYEAVVTNVTDSIKAAINKQFDAATAKGDLDAAEKWQTALERFEQAGDLPSDAQTKSTVATAIADYKKAREDLAEAYGSVVKSLTKEKKIAEAKLVRDELKVMATGREPSPEKPSRPSGDFKTKPQSPAMGKQNAPAKPGTTIVGTWHWNRGRLLTFLPNGTTDQGHTWIYDGETGLYRFSWNAVGELSKDGQTITEVKGPERFIYRRAAAQ